jgi:hypothetical protein
MCFVSKKYIFWFQVPVNNALTVAVVHGLQNSFDDKSSCFFIKVVTLFSQSFKEFSPFD